MAFRLGGKDMPFGKVELAYTGSGPGEHVRAFARLWGRRFICAIHDEVGNHFDASFIDMAAATLRGPAGVPTRTILLGNPGVPFHPLLQARYGIPAGYPEPGRAALFWSEDAGKHCIFASFTAASNQHLDLDQYIRDLRVTAGEAEIEQPLVAAHGGMRDRQGDPDTPGPQVARMRGSDTGYLMALPPSPRPRSGQPDR